MPLYLGFDCGTQSFNAVVVELDGARRRVVLKRSLAFDECFPAYGTTKGALTGEDPLVLEAPPLMWADALDRMMGLVAAELGDDVRRIAAITGSGQQHGSVYLNGAAAPVLAALDPHKFLVPQIRGVFSRQGAPIWMDSSTSAECEEITAAVGGSEALARLTGSRAFERFTGPQIRKISKKEPAAWARSHRVHLVSSYLATLLAGRHAPIDRGDGSGMNLMDLAAGRWSPSALAATAPDLADRLPHLVPSATVFARLSSYWTLRYGFSHAKLAAWTGDNPSSLVGVGVVTPGATAISLGTSDTLFAPLSEPTHDPSGAAHVFASPTGGFMSLVCFRNGSLAREHVRDAYGLDWAAFSEALRRTDPGNGGGLMLPWVEPEITPPVLDPGVRRSGLGEEDVAGNVRAVVEGQMLSMSLHSSWATPRVTRIHATGGAARNTEILQVMADVFDAPVFRSEVSNSACLGAALRAVHADAASEGHAPPWEEVVRGLADPSLEPVARPRPAAVDVYRQMRPKYAAFEERALSR
jgi:xylulokinase